MMRRATGLGLAIVLYGAAAAVPPESSLARWDDAVRQLSRPFVLPGLWLRLGDAARRGDPGEAIAAGRRINELVPDWTDGLVHVAWICALDLAEESDNPSERLDRLALGVGWLTEGADARRRRAPHRAAELWLAAATLVDARTDQDAALATSFRERYGRDPAALSGELIERAMAAAPDPTIRSRQAFATLRLIAGAVRMGDVQRAQRTLRVARAQLDALSLDGAARAAADALRRARPLAAYLADPPALADLMRDPWLGDVAAALEELRDG